MGMPGEWQGVCQRVGQGVCQQITGVRRAKNLRESRALRGQNIKEEKFYSLKTL